MSVLSDWTSCLTPALTRSSRPTRFPFFPFPFSSAIAILFSAHVAAGGLSPPARGNPGGALSPPKNARPVLIGRRPPPAPRLPVCDPPHPCRRGPLPHWR